MNIKAFNKTLLEVQKTSKIVRGILSEIKGISVDLLWLVGTITAAIESPDLIGFLGRVLQ